MRHRISKLPNTNPGFIALIFETGRSEIFRRIDLGIALLHKKRSWAGFCFLTGMKLCVFIERDGVLNQVRVERQHQVGPLTLEEFKINPDAASLLKKLKAAGLMLIATTNQPGISRGYQARRELDRMHDVLCRAVGLDDILICPHDESDRCSCRKPKPGMFMEAGFKWHLDLERCFVISDKWRTPKRRGPWAALPC